MLLSFFFFFLQVYMNMDQQDDMTYESIDSEKEDDR